MQNLMIVVQLGFAVLAYLMGAALGLWMYWRHGDGVSAMTVCVGACLVGALTCPPMGDVQRIIDGLNPDE